MKIKNPLTIVGSSENLNEVLDQQEQLINELTEALEDRGLPNKEEWFNDGNTHLWVSLSEGRTSPMVGVCPNGTVTIDWGDGTTPDVLTGTSTSELKFTPNHHYAEVGDYVITLTVDGEMGILPDEQEVSPLLCPSPLDTTLTYLYTLLKIEFGNNVTIGSYVVSTPTLTKVKLHSGVNIIGVGVFSYGSLVNIIIENGLKTIPRNTFLDCYTISKVALPPSVLTIESASFAGATSLNILDFSQHTTIPIIEDTSVFQGTAENLQIRVPMALVNEWKTAENWSAYADHIVGV